MKKVLSILVLCVGFLSCSSDDDDPKSNNPITNMEIPLSSNDKPIKSGESVTIKGEGFTQSSEIWFRVLTKSNDAEVKAEIVSVTKSGISFIAPTVSGERAVVRLFFSKNLHLKNVTHPKFYFCQDKIE